MLKYFFQAMEGKLIGDRYRLISLLGEGGIGFVARAEQVSVGRDVAIKFLSRSADDHEQVVRFKREAKALAMLRHPACLTLHDFDYSAELECYYMVTELVEGAEFGDAINAGMPLSDALRIMSHVCDALAYAHERGILHRDLKPQNVMVTSSHSAPVKLLDFGLARLYQSTFGDDDVKVSRTGHVYGTPAYMSPEQCMASEDIGPASDIYSLGVMLYELCSGRLPFDKGTMTQVLMSHITEDFEPLDEPDIPAELQDLIHWMLRKDPEDRPQDLYTVRAILEGIADQLGRAFTGPSRKTPLPMLQAIPAPQTPRLLDEPEFLTSPPNHPTLEGVPSEASASSLSMESDVFLLEDEFTPGRAWPRLVGLAAATLLIIVVGAGFAMAPGERRGEPVEVIELEPIPVASAPVRRVQVTPDIAPAGPEAATPRATLTDEGLEAPVESTRIKQDINPLEKKSSKKAAPPLRPSTEDVILASPGPPASAPAGASQDEDAAATLPRKARAKTLSFN